MKIYLQKNEKSKDSQPDLLLSQITEDGKFLRIASLWKAKSGKGYSGNLDTSKILDLKENLISDREAEQLRLASQTPKTTSTSTSKGVDGEVIDSDSIPF